MATNVGEMDFVRYELKVQIGFKKAIIEMHMEDGLYNYKEELLNYWDMMPLVRIDALNSIINRGIHAINGEIPLTSPFGFPKLEIRQED